MTRSALHPALHRPATAPPARAPVAAAPARRRAGVGLPLYLHRLATAVLQRTCVDAATCAAPIAGSAEAYVTASAGAEAGGRAFQRRREPGAFDLGSHGGRARQMEIFAIAEDPAVLDPVEGIFVDLALVSGAMLQDCADWAAENAPVASRRRARLGRATKPCLWVPGRLNQEAFEYNRGGVPRGWPSREDWRIAALQTVAHEARHAGFAAAPPADPAGVACGFADVEFELDELAALLSEFPIVFRPAQAPGAGAAEAARLADWFDYAVRNPHESIAGMLKALGCKCDCADLAAWVQTVFDDGTAGWSTAERDAFNLELRDPKWAADLTPVGWPL